ncbi:DUF5053 domain-containing protein [Capnocytophaga catalasegens]|uniref:DUF5053 domain-containing protein n=1 Tax=Capnocytophaga catalasegens TaxID=1004260 RepID=A0AAV5AVY8_9FLAO|nr:DUF5053 domain-containing protein [Capnocytophaga catalasegens]GIZ15104.1 hypothetical protein RCZ03_11040 [Capnocytophaga catalasegens]GJM50011.1 hypothetical protein RCZ15_09860 [Capnocytophaga catalasegens]GJM53882.1 hypothetical protein RCZ16_21980 [Capnocytophaga catalasegens]
MEIIISKRETTKKQIEDIALEISWAKISQRYFGKSASWIYNKLSEIDGNGGVGGFTETEKEQFKGALYDLAARIRKTADNFQ